MVSRRWVRRRTVPRPGADLHGGVARRPRLTRDGTSRIEPRRSSMAPVKGWRGKGNPVGITRIARKPGLGARAAVWGGEGAEKVGLARHAGSWEEARPKFRKSSPVLPGGYRFARTGAGRGPDDDRQAARAFEDTDHRALRPADATRHPGGGGAGGGQHRGRPRGGTLAQIRVLHCADKGRAAYAALPKSSGAGCAGPEKASETRTPPSGPCSARCRFARSFRRRFPIRSR